jgi:hypothetical protein
MVSVLIAGGSIISTLVVPPMPDLNNHLLSGSVVPAKEVVCRNRWGTPMMPTGKGSYNIATPPDQPFIIRSLIQPPKTEVPFYKTPSMLRQIVATGESKVENPKP